MTKKSKKIIVNCLTGSRILGALCMPVIFSMSSITGLLLLLSFLFVTDFLDGRLARAWKVQTKGGALLDPICDKALAFSCIISLVGTQSLLLIPLFLELCITGINVSRLFRGENTPSSITGKIKTWLLSITLVLCTINALSPTVMETVFSAFSMQIPNIQEKVIESAIGVTAVAEAFTAVSYMKNTTSKKSEREKKIEELYGIRETLIRLFDEKKFNEDKDKTLYEIRKKEGSQKCL